MSRRVREEQRKMVIWLQGNPLRKGTSDGLHAHELHYPHAIRCQQPAGSSALPKCSMWLLVTCSLQSHSGHLICASPISTEKSGLAVGPYTECKKIHVSCKEDKINPTSHLSLSQSPECSLWPASRKCVRFYGMNVTNFIRAPVSLSCTLTFLWPYPS